jgi:AP-2 complex subunit mu-1
MASSIVFINIKGEVLIYRCYKYDVSRQETMEFCRKIISTKEAKEMPIKYMNGVSYIFTQEGEIVLLATTKTNINTAMMFQFLYSFIKICKSYFGEFSEEKIRENFVLIYELLDECLDYGYPQLTDTDLLKKFIFQGKVKEEQLSQLKLTSTLTQLTGSVSWREPGISYANNEVYIDIMENINLLISKTGEVIKSEVMGVVGVKSLLSGWPECKFGMNDKLQLSKSNVKAASQSSSKGISIEDIRFHQCVKLSDFNKDRTITFIPPDGIFDLMTYRVSENVIIPFKIFCNIIETPTPNNPSIPQAIDLDLTVKALYDKELYAENVVVKIQIPKNSTNVKTHTNTGKGKHEVDKSSIIWRLKKIFGEKDYKLKCEIPLIPISDPKPWTRAPISMEFNIPMFTASGLRVRYFHVVEKANYKPMKWIRYVTKAGDFQFRI